MGNCCAERLRHSHSETQSHSPVQRASIDFAQDVVLQKQAWKQEPRVLDDEGAYIFSWTLSKKIRRCCCGLGKCLPRISLLWHYGSYLVDVEKDEPVPLWKYLIRRGTFFCSGNKKVYVFDPLLNDEKESDMHNRKSSSHPIATTVCGSYTVPPIFSGRNDLFWNCRTAMCPCCDSNSVSVGKIEETSLAASNESCPYFASDPRLHMSYLPRYRWLLIGEKGSGTTVHCDPAGTSAFNALIVGSKRWVFFPPGTPEEDLLVNIPQQGNVNINEIEAYTVETWFNSIYPKLADPSRKDGDSNIGSRMEVIQRAGEIVYVPAGYLHVVVNLELTVAISQNFGCPDAFPENGLDRLYEEFKAYDAISAAVWWQQLQAHKP